MLGDLREQYSLHVHDADDRHASKIPALLAMPALVDNTRLLRGVGWSAFAPILVANERGLQAG